MKIRLDDPVQEQALSTLRQRLQSVEGVVRVDINSQKQLIRIVSHKTLSWEYVRDILGEHGLRATLAPSGDQSFAKVAVGQVVKVRIEGMHCKSCEITIERKFRDVVGVGKVTANSAKGMARIVCSESALDLDALTAAVIDDGYRVTGILSRGEVLPEATDGSAFGTKERPTWWQLAGLFGAVYFLGLGLHSLGLLNFNVGTGNATTFGAAFILGLVAASSTCIAVSGGLLLSSAARFNARYVSTTPLARMRPVLLFVSGRILAYGILGGLIGLLGTVLSPSPLVTGFITIAAALYMLAMGLEMLGIAPSWLKAMLPHMPKSLSHRVMDADSSTHALAPVLLGAGTFFLPCGFTQALQLYALTTGSFWTSASILFAFALGTAPALLALGWVSGSLKGKAGQFFFRFAGALVVMLGLWNVQNGFTVMGYPLSWPSFSLGDSGQAASLGSDSNVTYDGHIQTVKMAVALNGYTPNQFTIRRGVPTRWEIEGTNAGGCLSVIQMPSLNIRQRLNPGTNVVEFTPTTNGTLNFSCSMGMYRGTMQVVDSTT